MTCVLDDVEHSRMMLLPLTYLMNSFLIIFINIIICCTCNIYPRVVKQATEIYTRPQREKTCLLGFRQSDSQTSLPGLTD